MAEAADVETAVPEALQHGSFFFADIEHNQVDAVGVEILRLMSGYDEAETVPREVLVAFVPSLMALEEALITLQNRGTDSSDGRRLPFPGGFGAALVCRTAVRRVDGSFVDNLGAN
ncbi:MAG: hypothetical protein M5U34_14345 [Chloroflexi bacterium]|nr:hypothetical protein [Chloroflexota bacterium]